MILKKWHVDVHAVRAFDPMDIINFQNYEKSKV
jgi:hypothetical protein